MLSIARVNNQVIISLYRELEFTGGKAKLKHYSSKTVFDEKKHVQCPVSGLSFLFFSVASVVV